MTHTLEFCVLRDSYDRVALDDIVGFTKFYFSNDTRFCEFVKVCVGTRPNYVVVNLLVPKFDYQVGVLTYELGRCLSLCGAQPLSDLNLRAGYSYYVIFAANSMCN